MIIIIKCLIVNLVEESVRLVLNIIIVHLVIKIIIEKLILFQLFVNVWMATEKM